MQLTHLSVCINNDESTYSSLFICVHTSIGFNEYCCKIVKSVKLFVHSAIEFSVNIIVFDHE